MNPLTLLVGGLFLILIGAAVSAPGCWTIWSAGAVLIIVAKAIIVPKKPIN